MRNHTYVYVTSIKMAMQPNQKVLVNKILLIKKLSAGMSLVKTQT